MNCSYYNSIDALTCLIENGADVNARTYHDQTPLIIADQIQGRSFPKLVDRSFHAKEQFHSAFKSTSKFPVILIVRITN